MRQYNKSKPDKFRVELFILACAMTFIIFHVDVYQGRNANNIDIEPEIADLPTTQKAPMNAVMKVGLHNSTDGMHHLSTDNRLPPRKKRKNPSADDTSESQE